ncbi:hypothetical protein [Methylobacterium radiodurans]|uniref:hypothetical protein n=1 Tax=Methylobacterium radiodurans TaxID=2202828 RepID=UPI001FEC9580|nr:hypothetical protein [Methylobacterium radiodurans]
MTAHDSPCTTPPAPVAETPLDRPHPDLILFGRGTVDRPRAAWFGATDAEAATAAAATMQLRTFTVADEAARDLAKHLARGRVLPSGRAHVPFVKQELYTRLLALADDEARPVGNGNASKGATVAIAGATPARAAAEPSATRPGERTFVGDSKPESRDEIGLGSVVLAHDGPDEGWWEAEVIGINGRVFSLRWQGWPTEPTILRKAGELALLPPGEA